MVEIELPALRRAELAEPALQRDFHNDVVAGESVDPLQGDAALDSFRNANIELRPHYHVMFDFNTYEPSNIGRRRQQISVNSSGLASNIGYSA